MVAEIDGTSKGLLGVFAVCILSSGIASLAYGIFLLIRNLNVEVNIGACNLFLASIVFIVIGSLLLIVVLLGLFGALNDASTLRLVALALLLLVFIALAITGVWAMVSFKTGRLEKSISDEINSLNSKTENATANLKKQANYLNKNFNCCILYESDTNSADAKDSHCTKTTENPENQKDQVDACVKTYYEQKSSTAYCLAVLSLAAAGATLIGLILYAAVLQRARARYAAVPH